VVVSCANLKWLSEGNDKHSIVFPLFFVLASVVRLPGGLILVSG